jgi:hypothetical protein
MRPRRMVGSGVRPLNLVVRCTLGESQVREPSHPWPFDQPRNCAVLTMRQVLEGSEPILLVAHDLDDRGWQFMGASDAVMADGRVVSLEEIVRLDSSVLEVANLAPGYHATREYVGGPWTRYRDNTGVYT